MTEQVVEGKRIYIAGPMRGHTFYNFPLFDEAREAVKENLRAFTPVSPADLDRRHGIDPKHFPKDFDWSDPPPESSLHDIWRRDINEVFNSSAILLLPGWTTSAGARAEAHLASCLLQDFYKFTPSTTKGKHGHIANIADPIATKPRPKSMPNMGGNTVTRDRVAEMMSFVFDNDIMKLREEGQKEYAHTNDNAFANFERGADDIGVDRKQVLWVYAMKHKDGISSWLKGHTSQREPVEGRINDLIVYLMLLRGMIEQEKANN